MRLPLEQTAEFAVDDGVVHKLDAEVAGVADHILEAEVSGLADHKLEAEVAWDVEVAGIAAHILDADTAAFEDQVFEDKVMDGLAPPNEVAATPEEEDIGGRVAEDILANEALLANIAVEEDGWVAVVTQSYPLYTVFIRH